MAQARHPAEAGVNEETIAAAATPAGGALAIVRVSGPKSRAVARDLLGLEAPVAKRATRRGAVHDGRSLDDVVAVFSAGPASATGEDMLELTCHGSPLVVRDLLDACVALGCRLAEPGEFTRRAFLNGRLDLAQAEAVADLGRARGAAARRAALARLRGGLSRRVESVRASLFDLLVAVEARLDHPEEELSALPVAETAAVVTRVRAETSVLLAGQERGRLLRDGARVGLFGRPNVGKSSLLNALLGRDRAIVSPRPGTTRDVLEESLELEGLPAVLVDTAGLREAPDEEEAEGVRRAEEALASCDVAVLVSDAGGPADDAAALFARARAARAGAPIVAVWNKCDLAAPPAGALAVSARTGEGLSALAAAVAAAAAPLDDEEAPACGARQQAALAAALEELDGAAADLAAFPGRWEDRLAARLRAADARLGEVLGEGIGEDVLDAVFSRFCLGK